MSQDLDSPVYPEINEKALILMAKIAENNKNYFDHPACPYSKEIKDILKGNAVYHDFDGVVDVELPSGEDLLSQISSLQKEIQRYGNNIDPDDSAGMNTYFRLSASLIEKLLALKQKAVDIDQFEKFTNFVIDILDRYLTVDSREVIMDKLREFVKSQKD